MARIIIGAGLFPLIAVALVVGGCHPSVAIVFENQTGQEVLVEVNDGGVEAVAAGSTDTFRVRTDDVDQFEIIVQTEDGEVLFNEVFTEDELEEIGNRIIIEEPSSSRPLIPEATNALPP